MNGPEILVLNQKIHGMPASGYRDAIRTRLPDADVRLATTPAERRELIPKSRIITGFSIDRAEIPRAEQLELFACTFAGTDHLPKDALAEHGVAVTSASGVHGPNAAEQVLAYLLAHVRRLGQAYKNTEAGTWQHYQAGELYGATVTVVGMGFIGTAILERLAPFGVERIGVRHSPEKDGPAERIVGYDAFEEVVPETDALILACPLTDTTRHLVDERIFGLLPPDAYLINIARGPVVDTDALHAALQANAIAGAALDVTDPEPLPHGHGLWSVDRCLITPHNAGHTPRYWDRRADILMRNYNRLANGETLENQAT